MKNYTTTKLTICLLFVACLFLCACKANASKKGKEKEETASIILEVSLPDVLKKLSAYNQDPSFIKAIDTARAVWKRGSTGFIDLFYNAWRQLEGDNQLVRIFSTYELRDRIKADASDEEVLSVLHDAVDGAIINTLNVFYDRLDCYLDNSPADSLRVQTVDAIRSGYIQVNVPKSANTERLQSFLTRRGRLEFWETYNNEPVGYDTGIFECLYQANELIKKRNDKEALADEDDMADSYESRYPLFSILHPSVDTEGRPYHTPVIGQAAASDTARINELLSLPEVCGALPQNLRFMWTAKPNSNDYYDLIALKVSTRDGKAPLDGSVIVDAKARESRYTSSWEVFIAMSKEGAISWSRLTADNISRAVAMVVDGKVYSYPIVQSEIVGGKSIISGNFTQEEAEDMAIMLKSGELPVPVRLIEVQAAEA